MPISLEWEPGRGLWRLTPGGCLALEEITQLTLETDWGNAKRYLWDLRNLRRGPDTPGELWQAAELARRNRALWDGSRVAIVVSRDLDYGVARMFQAFTEGLGITYAVCRDELAALAWLAGPPAS